MIVVCGQNEIMPDECVECGDWLHREVRGGYPAQSGRVCTEDCAASQSERIAQLGMSAHLNARDLLCDCPEVCAPRGLPSQAMRDEYAAYLEQQGRVTG